MVKTTEVEEIKQRGKNTQKNCTLSQIGYLSPYRLVTHLEPEILDCEVKRVLGSITRDKASGGDGIPAELFKILKDDGVKLLHSICQQNLENPAGLTGLGKVSFQPNSKEGQC